VAGGTGAAARGALFARPGPAVAAVVAAGSRTPQGQEIIREMGQAVQAEGPVLVNEAEAVLAQAQTLRQAIATVPNDLFQPMKCTQCAEAIVKTLAERGITGEILNIRANGGLAFMANDLLKGTTTITNNGFHQAIRVGDLVFDNFFRNGVHYAIYVQSIQAPVGVSITAVSF